MSQIQESAGNSILTIDHKKVLMARQGSWTLERLGIELKKPEKKQRKVRTKK